MATGALVPKLIGTVSGFVIGTLITAGSVFLMINLSLVSPDQTHIGIMAAYLIGTTVGGTGAGLISKRSSGAIIAVGVLLLLVGALNLTMAEHPDWFKLCTPIPFVLGSFAAVKITRNQPDTEP